MEETEFVDCNLCNKPDTKTFFVRDGFRIVVCRHCGLIYVNPRLKLNVLTDQYNSEYYDYSSGEASAKERLAEELERKISCYRKPGRMLEIGPGSGTFMDYALRKGWDVTGIEVSRDAARLMGGPAGRIITGKFEEQDFAPRSFDAVVMCEVLEHMPDPLLVLKKAAGILKKDGLLMLTAPNVRTPNFRIRGESTRIILPREHLYYFTAKTLKKLLNKAGFVIVKIETYDHNLAGLLEDVFLLIGIRLPVQRFFEKPHEVSSGHYLARRLIHPYYKLVSKIWKTAVIPLTQSGQTIRVFARPA